MDTTKLVPANMANSLRTTVPMSIVKQLNLKQGDSLEWSMDKVNNRWIVSVRKK
ncbi:MAG: AbrB/MazE/SpoVT family DNA-binding domain-containing protein [Thaumarchaeota archaeon]|nr:AbrB/MazE/SpoVT family DNA-binding domain-containing protein [Nitrososphaerota archaeon]